METGVPSAYPATLRGLLVAAIVILLLFCTMKPVLVMVGADLTLRILSSVPQLSSFTHRHSLKILAELEDKFPMKNTGEYTYPSISGKTKTPRILLNYT